MMVYTAGTGHGTITVSVRPYNFDAVTFYERSVESSALRCTRRVGLGPTALPRGGAGPPGPAPKLLIRG